MTSAVPAESRVRSWPAVTGASLVTEIASAVDLLAAMYLEHVRFAEAFAAADDSTRDKVGGAWQAHYDLAATYARDVVGRTDSPGVLRRLADRVRHVWHAEGSPDEPEFNGLRHLARRDRAHLVELCRLYREAAGFCRKYDLRERSDVAFALPHFVRLAKELAADARAVEDADARAAEAIGGVENLYRLMSAVGEFAGINR